MDYVSFCYLGIILPVILVLYKITAKSYRWLILLISNCVFFYLISGGLIVYLFWTTISIYFVGICLSYFKKEYLKSKKVVDDVAKLKTSYIKKKRIILLVGILFNMIILGTFKYFDFLINNTNLFFKALSITSSFEELKLVAPIGISFYTLQAISYIVDVYQEKIEADTNLGRLALFMSFFPIIMEGPICRYSDIAESLYAGEPLKYKNVTFGVQRIIWGVFKNIVIADRLNLFIKNVFDSNKEYGGVVVILGAIFYTLQLYMNFSGTIDITIGIGEMFGVKIPENFRQPFFSKTPSEFWQRWHITLGTWFKDYIFYPLSLTKWVKKIGKKTRKKYGKNAGKIVTSAIALFAVWLSNGIWHGSRWSYIFYGMYYFILILLGKILEPYNTKVISYLRINKNKVVYRVLQTVKMLVIIFTGEMFFRANGIKAGLSMLNAIFTKFSLSDLSNGTISELGMDVKDLWIILIAVIIVFIVGLLKEKGISIREEISNMNIFIRWNFYYIAILIIIIFGAYGEGYVPADLIYAGF